MSTYDIVMREALPAAMAIGISWGDFWEMTPADLEACAKGKQKAVWLDFSRFSQKAWLQGAYIQQAVASVLSKQGKYPKKPVDIEPPLSPDERLERDRLRAIAFFNAFADRHKGKGVTNGH